LSKNVSNSPSKTNRTEISAKTILAFHRSAENSHHLIAHLSSMFRIDDAIGHVVEAYVVDWPVDCIHHVLVKVDIVYEEIQKLAILSFGHSSACLASPDFFYKKFD